MPQRVLLSLLLPILIQPSFSNNSSGLEKPEPHIHHNNYELMLGSTSFQQGYSSRLTIGFDYEKRFRFGHDHFGIGFLMDYEFGNEIIHSELLLTPTLMYFPTSSFKTLGSVGMGIDHYHQFVLYRLGFGYEIEVTEKYLISPTVYWDSCKDYNALVFGLSFGLGY